MNWKYYLPAILWAALIFSLSSLPSNSVPSFGIAFEDLFAHFAVYSILGYFLALAFMHSGKEVSRKRILAVIAIGVFYGALDEFHQWFVPGRIIALSDFLADSAGILFGLFVFIKMRKASKFVQGQTKNDSVISSDRINE